MKGKRGAWVVVRDATFITGRWRGQFYIYKGFPEQEIIPEHSYEARRRRYFN